MNRLGLERFKKAQSAEPFKVESAVASKPQIPTSNTPQQSAAPKATESAANPTVFAVGNGNSTYKVPDWAVEPRTGMYTLEVIKDGTSLGAIPLDKKRVVFGRQVANCDLVLEHPSVSRQHAVLLHHKNGRVFVIDLGSVHGTFISNERLRKDVPCELEVGQSMRFAASSRSYVLRQKTNLPSSATNNVVLPPPPDPNDSEAVLAYNTILNRFGVAQATNSESKETNVKASAGIKRASGDDPLPEMHDHSSADGDSKQKWKKKKVSFRDYNGGLLADVVGIYHDSNVLSSAGKFDSLVKTTVVPKERVESSVKEKHKSEDKGLGLTKQFQEYLQHVKNPIKSGGLYQGLDNVEVSFAGGSWAINDVIADDNNGENDKHDGVDSNRGDDEHDGVDGEHHVSTDS